MSMSALINGADCGPSNALQGLTKQLDRDRGAQQDHFGNASQPGPSRLAFRTLASESPHSSQFAQEAHRFFSNAQSPSLLPQPRPFSPLTERPLLAAPAQRQASRPIESLQTWQLNTRLSQDPAVSRAAADWTADFANSPQTSGNVTPSTLAAPAQNRAQITQPQPYMPMAYGAGQYLNQQPMWNMQSTAPVQLPKVEQNRVAPDWAAQFASIDEETLPATVTAPVAAEPSSSTITVDDLSATAALLLSSVQHESNPKFQNSEFMGLMRRLRDRDAIVDGNEIIDKETRASVTGVTNSLSAGWQDEFSATAPSFSTLDKGKGRALDDTLNDGASGSFGTLPATTSYNVAPGFYDAVAASGINPSLYSQTLRAEMNGATETKTSTSPVTRESIPDYANDISSYFESLDLEDDGDSMLGRDYLLNNDALNGQERYEELGRMQAEWDALDAAIEADGQARAMSPQYGYQFQRQNPYYMEATSSSSSSQAGIHATAHSGLPYQSVLQTEAAVQRDPSNASAWFLLGVKQQENEREDKAIQALNRALELEPTHSAALLALAVSHTNENNREGTLSAIDGWIDVQAKEARHRDAVHAHRSLNPLGASSGASIALRQKDLVECLMTMARMSPNGEIDADTQIALGVLLNTSEEYEKARDCFQTALAVRPDDPLLYNRVGATLANSGRAVEALDYYYRALELNPSYIRARFNLGISCINLKMFHEAAQHILDALVLQDIDASSDANAHDASGISSSSLWDSLRTTCMHLQRNDLVTLCEKKDLSSFRDAFAASGPDLQAI